MRPWPAPLLLLLSLPALAADEAEIAAGRTLFEAHCQICHGSAADEGEAGDISGVTRSVVARAVRGIEQMPAFTFTKAELEALVAYLAYLWEQ